jgi:hypothetical protein
VILILSGGRRYSLKRILLSFLVMRDMDSLAEAGTNSRMRLVVVTGRPVDSINRVVPHEYERINPLPSRTLPVEKAPPTCVRRAPEKRSSIGVASRIRKK